LTPQAGAGVASSGTAKRCAIRLERRSKATRQWPLRHPSVQTIVKDELRWNGPGEPLAGAVTQRRLGILTTVSAALAAAVSAAF
jgi:hypothetical protein